MICENCGKEHDGSYGSGRFCCKECAHSFTTKLDKKDELKEAKCIKCGKTIYINKRASIKKCICDDCLYKEGKTLKRFLICPICGEKHNVGTKCNDDFCNNHDVQQFSSLIKYFGFNKEKLKTKDVEKEFLRIREILYNLYWKDCLSSAEICNKFNYPNAGNLTAKVFNYLNIPIKSCSEATSENIVEGRLNIDNNKNRYKSEWHTTWDGKEVYLRSSYEIDYANELDKQKIKYDVECLRIKYFNTNLNEYHCAVPDFYLIDTNTIVEIKSTWTLDIQEMRDKVKAYKDLGYNFKLILEHKDQTDLLS